LDLELKQSPEELLSLA
jgi:hypothetical protein